MQITKESLGGPKKDHTVTIVVLCGVILGFGLGRIGHQPIGKHVVDDCPDYAAVPEITSASDMEYIRSSTTTGSVRSASKVVAAAAADKTALTSSATSTANSDAAGAVDATVGQPGWHPVHVYYGNRDHHSPDPSKTKFSQSNQDMIALELLQNKRQGYFVELAANHPTELSNTYLLERDYDWNGLCIEPNWQYWNALASIRKCTVIGAVGGGTVSEVIKFRFHPFKRFIGAFGGIVGDNFDNKENPKDENKELIEESRYTVALAEIFDTFGAPSVIDYLSLDVEGAEDLIMTPFPFDKYTFRVLNVERPSKTLRELLESHGYIYLKSDRYGDTIWKHKSVTTNLVETN